MNTDFIKGVIVPILMPIDKDENIDEAKLRKQVDFVIKGGVHGILLFGSNGEFFAMEYPEMEKALEIVMDQTNGRVPVYCGIGTITTRAGLKIAKMAAAQGAQGISILQPMFIAPSDDELYDHYRTIAQSVPDMPTLIYNNPRVGYGIKPELGVRMAKTVDNIVGIKDSSGNMNTLSEFVRLSQGIDFKVLAGKDTMIMTALAAGAAGCVATTANFVPELVVSIYDLYMAGKLEESRAAQYKLTPLRNTLDLGSFPVGTKDAANLLGLDVGSPYLPNKLTSGEKLEKMRKLFIEEGYIKA